MNKFFLFLAFCVFSACGGGSSGTGVITTYEGTIRDGSGQPLGGAIVQVIETGDSDISDNNGNFSVELSSENDINTISIQSESGNATFIVSLNPTDSEGSAMTSSQQEIQVSGSIVQHEQ